MRCAIRDEFDDPILDENFNAIIDPDCIEAVVGSGGIEAEIFSLFRSKKFNQLEFVRRVAAEMQRANSQRLPEPNRRPLVAFEEELPEVSLPSNVVPLRPRRPAALSANEINLRLLLLLG